MRGQQISTMNSGIKISMLHKIHHYVHLSPVIYYLVLFLFCFLLISCESTQRTAPVVDRAFNSPSRSKHIQEENNRTGAPDTYMVQKGDTLYSIALKHNVNHEVLAEWNGISDPGSIKPGQQINVTAPSSQLGPSSTASVITESVTVKPVVGDRAEPLEKAVKTTPKAFKLPYSEEAVDRLARAEYIYPIPKLVKHPVSAQNQVKNNVARIEAAPVPVTVPSDTTSQVSEWIWPTKGKLMGTFSERSKGIEISGDMGQPVLATAKGKVVYSGDGLRGYGKLIIIKHNNTYLSAYAHNSKILVKESESVEQGQKIAEMGNSDADKVKLRFEIRKHGQPINPLKFLSSEN